MLSHSIIPPISNFLHKFAFDADLWTYGHARSSDGNLLLYPRRWVDVQWGNHLVHSNGPIVGSGIAQGNKWPQASARCHNVSVSASLQVIPHFHYQLD